MKKANISRRRRPSLRAVVASVAATATLCCLSVTQTAQGQTAVNFKAQSKNIDFTGAPYTRPVKTGTTLPATCSVGDLFFNTAAAAGQNLNMCATQNTWSQVSGSGGGSGLSDPGSNGLLERTGLDTTAVVGSAGAPLQAQNIENIFYADQFANIQAAIAAAGSNGVVAIPATYTGTDAFTNPNGIPVYDYRSGAGSVYSAKTFGCKGDGVTDDTACLTSFVAFLNNRAHAVGYFPVGKYLMNGTLHLNTSVWLRGDGYADTFLIETNPTADLLVLSAGNEPGWESGVIVTDIALAGRGPATTGNLAVVANGRTRFQNMAFRAHGGRGILLEYERGTYTNLQFSHIRQAIVASANISLNEIYLRDFTIMSPGQAQDELYSGTSWCYNVNSDSNGNYPGSGAIQQDPHTAIDLNGIVTNFEIAQGSIKPTTCVGGIRVRGAELMSVEHVYVEGYTNGSVNPSLVYGGNHEKTALTSAITATATQFDIADGKWFAPFVGSASDLQTGAAVYLIRPPDYSPGSTATSSLGNGITKGSFEYVVFQGIVHDGLTSGWHAYLSSRGAASTTAVAWPAGAILEEGWGSPGDTTMEPYPGDIRLVDNHFNSVASLNGYTVTCNNGNEQSCGELVAGVEPDAFFVPGSSNLRLFAQGFRFDGTDQMFCSSGPGGVIDTYYNTDLDFRGVEGQGAFIDQGGSLVPGTNMSAGLVGACSINREVFPNGYATSVTYHDSSSWLYASGGSTPSLRGYSLNANSGVTSGQPAMFIPNGGSFHIAAHSPSNPLPWDWMFTSGLQQFNNGTAQFVVDGYGNVSTPATIVSPRMLQKVHTVNFSATPTFDVSTGDQSITLTGNVTSSAVVNLSAGQRVSFRICQDSTGGRTFAWPSSVHGAGTVGSTANTCTVQQFESFDGSILNALAPAVANQ